MNVTIGQRHFAAFTSTLIAMSVLIFIGMNLKATTGRGQKGYGRAPHIDGLIPVREIMDLYSAF